MKRIVLFLATNFAIMLVLSITMRLLGVEPYLNANGLNLGSLLVFAGVMGFGGSLISLAISKWSAKTAMGVHVIEAPSNSTEFWLLETIRKYSVEVGIKMPEVGIYESPDVNAFATGMSKNSSLIAVSTGLLQKMTRQEAEAVLGHEVAHAANGDMVTMALIQGVVNTFVIFISRILAQLAAGFMGGNRDEGEESNGNPLIYFAVATVLELVFGILASIITMWFSRHREFHADAGSAKLVGREKMIAALQRLKTSYEPQEATSMMAFCINGKSKSLSELFMTHPPLDKRIEALRTGEYLK